MNKKIRFLTILLAFVMMFSTLVACDDEGDPQDPDTPPTTSGVPNVIYSFDDGIHDFTAPETDNKYIVKNGQSDYKILLSKNASNEHETAANTLVTLFNEATGITLPIVVESDELQTSTTDKYFSIGDTELFNANYNRDEEIPFSMFKYDGVRIITKDNTIFLNGGVAAESAHYAVIDFLQITLNFEAYSREVHVIDKNVTDLKLRNYNVTDIPDVPNRYNTSIGYTSGNLMYYWKARTGWFYLDVGDKENGAKQETIHNTTEIFWQGYPGFEDAWQSDNGEQACYSAHGDPESQDRMAQRAADVIFFQSIIPAYNSNPNFRKRLAIISMEDNHNICSCAGCYEKKVLYGNVESGVIVQFNNLVCEKLQTLMETYENGKYNIEGFRVGAFAYNAYTKAPAHWDETANKYVPNHPDLEPHPMSMVEIADLYINCHVDINHPDNAELKQNIEKWGAVSNALYYWLYNWNFATGKAYLGNSFWPTFDHFDTDGIQFYVAQGCEWFFHEQLMDQINFTSFHVLKMYLRYKLFWDCTLDSDVLTDNWFNACFAEAAPIMKKYFNSINQFTLSALNRAGFDEYYIGYNYMQSDLWSITIIYEWFDYIEDAMSVIQMNYQDSDPEYYEIIKRNILFEAVWPATALSVMFNPTSGGDRFVKIIKYFADNEGTYFKDFGRLPERQFRDTSLI